VAIKTLVVLVLLYLFSLAGALTFPALAAITSGTEAEISSVLLFLVAMILLSLIGTLIARGIRSIIKESMKALLSTFVGSFFMGATLAFFALLNIPNTVRVNLNWLGTSWYSPLLTLLFIGIPLMLVFLFGDYVTYEAFSHHITSTRMPLSRYPFIRAVSSRIILPRQTSSSSLEPITLVVADNSAPIIHLRVIEEPLTAFNFTNILSAFTELHTKSWMISNKRFGDLIEYTQTRNPEFVKETGLIIEKIKHNSPPDIKFNLELSPKNVMEALKVGIDAIVQTPLRIEETKLENQAKTLEMKIKEIAAQSNHTSTEQTLQIEAQKAELGKQRVLLEIEKEQIEVEKQRLELQEKRLEIERKRIDYALEAASKMVIVLRPDADAETRDMLIRSLLPNLLQLGNATGVEVSLPAPQSKQDENKDK